MKDNPIMVTGVAAIVALLLFITAKLSLVPSPQNAPARPGEYLIHIPQACGPKIMEMTHGKSRIDEMPVQDFLNLKRFVESPACGGKMTLVEK